MRNVCTIDGCGRWVRGHGFCSMHYNRWRLNGDPLVVRRVAKYAGQGCSVEGCPNVAKSLGYCTKHWANYHRTGSPIPWQWVQGKEACAVADCDTAARVSGWCNNHYARWRRHGNPEIDKRSTGCSICHHPDRAAIEQLMFAGESRDAILSRYDFSSGPLVRHRKCLGLPKLGHTLCRVCQHPDLEEIDALIDRRDAWVSTHSAKRPPSDLQWLHIAQRFGFDVATPSQASKVFQYHRSVPHAQARALHELGRLNALKETA